MTFKLLISTFCKKIILPQRIFFSGIFSLLILTGCGLPTLSGLVNGLNQQTDLELVCDGSASYLLLLDSLVTEDPDNISLLLNATKAYSAYVEIMPECGRPERSAVLSEKLKKHGLRLLFESARISQDTTLPELSAMLATRTRKDVKALFWAAYSWAKWISYQQGAPAAVINLPKIEMIMKRVVELDETYYNGGAHLFLGIYYTLKPVIYGGDPVASNYHFQKALAISENHFLPIQVAYAENYAKMIFDRDLYEKLIEEILSYNIASTPPLALSNLIAQKQARIMLEGIDDYF